MEQKDYNTLNQLTQETYDDMQMDYTYDQVGNRLSKTVSKAGTYQYNGAN
ncbi:hypothetical protein ACIQ7N_17590 [Lysinibacillus sp. NPDC095746]